MGVIIKNEKLYTGSQSTDLSNYYTKAEVDAAIPIVPTTDTELNAESANPIANSAVAAGLENKLNKDDNIGSVTYTQYTEDFKLNSTDLSAYGELVHLQELVTNKLNTILFLKRVDDRVYVGGQGGFGYFDTNMETYTSMYDISTSSGASSQYTFIDICVSKAYEGRYYLTALNQQLPFYYLETDGTLNTMTDLSNRATSGVSPTRLFEYVTGASQSIVYAIDTNSLKIEVIEWGGVINSVIDIATDFAVTGSFTSFAEYNDTMFISIGSHLLYFNIMLQDWEDFEGLSTFSPSAGAQIIKVYAKEDGVYIFSEDGLIRSNYYNYETCSWEEMGGEWNTISADSSDISLSTDAAIFGKNNKVYCLQSGRFFTADLDTGINFKLYGNSISGPSLPYIYVSYWYYNEETNKFYILTQNNGLVVLEYASEQQNIENRLQYIQTLENQIQQLMDRVLLLEELQGI